jgi:hypothetical protein
VDVRHTREHEKKIGEPIEVNDDQCRNLDLPLKADHSSLSATANCPRYVKNGALSTSARNDEGLERLQLLLAFVDRVLEVPNPPLVDVSLGQVAVHFLEVGSGEQSTDAEEIALHRDENLIDARHGLDGASHAEDGVELVDVAVGLDARIVFLNSAAAEQAGVAGVAGFRVNPHRRESTLIHGSELQTEDYLPGAFCGQADGYGLALDAVPKQHVANRRPADCPRQVVFSCS